MARASARSVRISRYDAGAWKTSDDEIASEEPLQLLLDGQPLSVIMRTPGNDIELALGLLHAERVITALGDVASLRISAEAGEREGRVPVSADLVESNAVDVRLARTAARRPRRSFLSSSACGVCGATTLDDLAHDHEPLGAGPVVDATALPPLAARLRERQDLFERTGGLHAAGLFSASGELLTLREDIGRHNAVDKVVGRALLDAADVTGTMHIGNCVPAGSNQPHQSGRSRVAWAQSFGVTIEVDNWPDWHAKFRLAQIRHKWARRSQNSRKNAEKRSVCMTEYPAS